MEAAVDELILDAFTTVSGGICPIPSTIGSKTKFPKFPSNVLMKLVDLAKIRFKRQEVLIKLPLGTYIVGDLHGNIHDLLRILGSVGDFFSQKFLFLGDYVDRGQFSIEVITLLFALTVAYPENVFLIRGNHEFSDVNGYYGFKDEVINEYSDKALWKQFNEAFNYMPICAIVGETNLCIHGGLSSKLSMTAQIASFQRPITNCENVLLMDLMWSDPSCDTQSFIASSRGGGCNFGQQVTSTFLKNNNFTRLIRAHQCVLDGIGSFFGGLGLTVFSSSNYERNNVAAFIRINMKNNVIVHKLEPLNEVIERSNTVFVPVLNDIQQTSISSSFNENLGQLYKLNFHPTYNQGKKEKQNPFFLNHSRKMPSQLKIPLPPKRHHSPTRLLSAKSIIKPRPHSQIENTPARARARSQFLPRIL